MQGVDFASGCCGMVGGWWWLASGWQLVSKSFNLSLLQDIVIGVLEGISESENTRFTSICICVYVLHVYVLYVEKYLTCLSTQVSASTSIFIYWI